MPLSHSWSTSTEMLAGIDRDHALRTVMLQSGWRRAEFADLNRGFIDMPGVKPWLFGSG